MAVLEVRRFPDPILQKKAAPVEKIDHHVHTLIDDMIETLYAVPGIGLAAPQVGSSLRLFIYDLRPSGIEEPLTVVINPEMISEEGRVVEQEGCLSVPDYYERVSRAEKVVVSGLDREGKEIRIEGEGLLARVLQHETDHVNGLLLLDRLSSLKKNIALKRLRKIKRMQPGVS